MKKMHNSAIFALLGGLLWACGDDSPSPASPEGAGGAAQGGQGGASPSGGKGGAAGKAGIGASAGQGGSGKGGVGGTDSQGGAGISGMSTGGASTGGATSGGMSGSGGMLAGESGKSAGGAAGSGAGQGGNSAGNNPAGSAGQGGDGGLGGQGGLGGAGQSGQGGGGWTPSTCVEAHGWTGCCLGDDLYRSQGAGLPVEVFHCALNGETCGWSLDSGRYDCQATAQEAPGGSPPSACEATVAINFCAGACLESKDCPPSLACDVTAQTCVLCLLDSDCQAGEHCLNHDCVDACQNDAQCSSGHCQPQLGACVDCLGDTDCPSGHCDTSRGACLACLSDEDCPTLYIQEEFCHPPHQICKKKKLEFRCNESNQCESTCQSDQGCQQGEVCHPIDHRCVTCYQDKNCIENGSGKVCDVTLNTCLECLLDADCGDETKRCESNLCSFYCTKDAHCLDPLAPRCQPETGQCGQCLTSNDCTNPSFPCCEDQFNCVQCLSDDQCPGGTCALGYCAFLCASDADCQTLALPHCLPPGKCFECVSDTDCKDADKSHCGKDFHECLPCEDDVHCPENSRCVVESSGKHGCVAEPVSCPSDDNREDADDVRAGATDGTPAPGKKSSQWGGAICNKQGELDWFSFQANQGDTWRVQLDEGSQGAPEVRVEVVDVKGLLYGHSMYDNPHQIELTYLPAGKYFIRIKSHDFFNETLPYLLSIEQEPGGCQSDDQCDDSYQTQLFRARCEQGACVRLGAPSSVPAGGVCDSLLDCLPGLFCPSAVAPHGSNASQRSFCTTQCQGDSDCPAGQLCQWQNGPYLCLPSCSTNTDCGSTSYDQPTPGLPWHYGKCLQGRCD